MAGQDRKERMAWNDPPSFDYQQISNSGRKFKHRYVLSDTKLGQQQSSPISAAHYQQQTQAPTLGQQLQYPGQQQSFGADPNHLQHQQQQQQQQFQQHGGAQLQHQPQQPFFEPPMLHNDKMNNNSGTMSNYLLGTTDNFNGNGTSSQDQMMQFNQIQPAPPQMAQNYPEPFPPQPQ